MAQPSHIPDIGISSSYVEAPEPNVKELSIVYMISLLSMITNMIL